MFTTKLTLLLKDCKGNVVFKSKEGISREKEFALSYSLALKDAFTSLTQAKYVYQPAPAINDQPVASTTSSNPGPPRKSTVIVRRPAPGPLYAQQMPQCR